VILLALACGVPVLTTRREDWEGFLFDEYNALLVTTGEYKAITEKMLKIHKNAWLRNKIVENGLRTYDKYFSEEKMANDTIRLFKQ
jgi:glycosyltransferase involved in cell wall biosynthesis